MSRVLVGLMLAQGASAADVQVLHSGRLLSAAGQPIDGAVDLDVALFSSASGGSPVFDDLFDDLSIQDGYYSVTLGAAPGHPLDSALFSAPLWVEVKVGNTILGPRNALHTVPYAANASGGLSPVLSSVSPAIASTDGGTLVTLTGSGFQPGASVRVGPNAATSVTRVNDSTITFLSPPASAGAYSVKVTNPGGASDLLGEALNVVITDVPFAHTGSAQTWTVPVGVTSVVFRLWGGGGGAGGHVGSGGDGGGGGFVTGTLSVTPGEVLTVYVGGGGTRGLPNGQGSSARAGGFGYGAGGNGGTSDSEASGGGGGGGSAIVGPGSLVLAVAGGGGGGGGYIGAGGAGGGLTGVHGGNSSGGCVGGVGGDQSSAGVNGQNGILTTGHYPSGGGGGGWEGGAYASHNCFWDRGGAGGGSGYVHPSRVTNSTLTQGANRQPAGTTNPKYPVSAPGWGGNHNPSTDGTAGYVLISQ